MPSDVRFAREAFENLESPFLDEEIALRGGNSQTEADIPLEAWSAAEDTIAAEEAGDTDEADMSVDEAFAPFVSEEVEEEIIGQRDTRVRVGDTLQVPSRWICAIDVMSENPQWGSSSQPRLICRSRGTGTLIGPRYVLTAAHVFSATATAAAVLPAEHTVSPARNGDNSRNAFGKTKSASIRVPRPYRIQQRLRVEGRLVDAPVTVWDDYALVTLAKDVASATHSKLKGSLGFWGQNPQVAVVKRLDRGVLDKKKVVVIGYPGDACGSQILSGSSSEKASKANKCWFNRNDAWASTQWRSEGELTVNAPGTLVFHDADTYLGQSGAPICLKIGGVLHLVAIHTAPHDAQHNKGVPVTLRMLRDLCDWINADAGYEAAIIQNDTLSFQPVPKAGAKELPVDVASEEHAPLSHEWWRGPSSAEGPSASSPSGATDEVEQAEGPYEPEAAAETEVLDGESFEPDADAEEVRALALEPS
jgi:V8-like Glu-specific endopeptidase